MTSRISAATVIGLALLALGVLAWESGRGNVAYAQSNCSTGSAGLSSPEGDMVVLINAARAANGAGPLLVSPALNQAAAWMAEDFSPSHPPHQDSLGRGPNARAAACGYPGQAAENIAWGYSTANSAFNGWMGSTGHRNNILNSNYNVIGVGFANGVWVANFGIVVDSGAYEYSGGTPPPPPPPPTATNPPTQPTQPNNPPVTYITPTPSGGSAPAPSVTPAASPTYWNPDVQLYPQGPVIPRVKVPMLARQ